MPPDAISEAEVLYMQDSLLLTANKLLALVATTDPQQHPALSSTIKNLVEAAATMQDMSTKQKER